MGLIQMEKMSCFKGRRRECRNMTQRTEGTFTNHKFDKGLVPRPDKELLKFARNDKSPVLNQAKGRSDVSLEHRCSGWEGGAGETVQQLGASVKDLCLILKPHLRYSQPPIRPGPEGSRDSFWLLQVAKLRPFFVANGNVGQGRHSDKYLGNPSSINGGITLQQQKRSRTCAQETRNCIFIQERAGSRHCSQELIDKSNPCPDGRAKTIWKLG